MVVVSLAALPGLVALYAARPLGIHSYVRPDGVTSVVPRKTCTSQVAQLPIARGAGPRLLKVTSYVWFVPFCTNPRSVRNGDGPATSI